MGIGRRQRTRDDVIPVAPRAGRRTSGLARAAPARYSRHLSGRSLPSPPPLSSRSKSYFCFAPEAEKNSDS